MLHFRKGLSLFVLLGLSVVASQSVAVGEGLPDGYVKDGYVKDGYVKERQSALASDRSSSLEQGDPAVAREILQLQQQLGGSMVRGRTELQGWPTEAPAFPPRRTPEKWPSVTRNPQASRPSHALPPQTKVRELREAAWQLDTTAYRLENLDLYDQADALRELGSRLRRDARGMQSIGKAKGASVGRKK